MSEIIYVTKKNESFMQITSEDVGIYYELKEYFAYDMPNAKYHPKVKAGVWDGKIRLFQSRFRTLPLGLYVDLIKFCKDRDYTLELVGSEEYGDIDSLSDITEEEAGSYVRGLNSHSHGKPLEHRDYQITAVYNALLAKRLTVLSPTSSGKSNIIYSIIRYLTDELNLKVIIIVPTTQLVEQLAGDFGDYSSEVEWDAEANIHKIYDGASKKVGDKPICISTWQSLQGLVKENSDWFNQFDAVIVDEAHTCKAQVLTSILERCINAEYRLGFTGSLDNSHTNKTVIKGMFGPVFRVAHTIDLINNGQLSEIKIKSVLLKYSPETLFAMKKCTYDEEIRFLFNHKRRNKFIANLALSLKDKNILILYSRVETHGQIIYDLIKENTDRPVHFINGDVAVEDRIKVGKEMKEYGNVISIASYQTTQAGINFPEIDAIILASPTKSIVRVLQSLGRGLRRADGKTHFDLFDIGDLLSKNKKNHTYLHFIERLKIYLAEQFTYKITEVEIE